MDLDRPGEAKSFFEEALQTARGKFRSYAREVEAYLAACHRALEEKERDVDGEARGPS